MSYQVIAHSQNGGNAGFEVRYNEVNFGVATDEEQLPNPAELLLGAFAACCLKNVERFSKMLKFDYERAEIEVEGIRQDAPSKVTDIKYRLRITTQQEDLNTRLLHKNIKRHSTVFNTLRESCNISGEISKNKV